MTITISAAGKLKIISLDDNTTCTAHFNPKEVQFDKSVPWQKQKKSKGDAPDLEFAGAEGMTMSFELMFDSFETPTGNAVRDEVDKLIKMASVDESKKRPHKCKVILGEGSDSVSGGIFPFQGVIESLSTKFTMFSPEGKCLRATCNIKFKLAADLKVKEGGS